MSVTDHLQEMADIAQDQGMHPDNINAVCDSFIGLLAACKELSGAIEEQGSLEVDSTGEPVSQQAYGRNYERRCVARAKAIAAIANAEGRAS